MKISINI